MHGVCWMHRYPVERATVQVTNVYNIIDKVNPCAFPRLLRVQANQNRITITTSSETDFVYDVLPIILFLLPPMLFIGCVVWLQIPFDTFGVALAVSSIFISLWTYVVIKRDSNRWRRSDLRHSPWFDVAINDGDIVTTLPIRVYTVLHEGFSTAGRPQAKWFTIVILSGSSSSTRGMIFHGYRTNAIARLFEAIQHGTGAKMDEDAVHLGVVNLSRFRHQYPYWWLH